VVSRSRSCVRGFVPRGVSSAALASGWVCPPRLGRSSSAVLAAFCSLGVSSGSLSVPRVLALRSVVVSVLVPVAAFRSAGFSSSAPFLSALVSSLRALGFLCVVRSAGVVASGPPRFGLVLSVRPL